MRLGILQPYFFPYLGYYQLVNDVDHLVFLDDVKYIKNGWLNRNQINSKQGKAWITLQAKKSTLSLISTSEPSNLTYDLSKISKTISQTYSKAPYFKNGIKFLDEFIDKTHHYTSLSKVSQESIISVFEYLGIRKSFSCSSTLSTPGIAQSRVIEICKMMEADNYTNPIGGTALYDKNEFKNNGITLSFLRKKAVSLNNTPHYWEDNASILDLIFLCNKNELINLLGEYDHE